MTSIEKVKPPQSFYEGEIFYIQYLRGVAAILVVYFHTKVYNSNLEWHVDRSFGFGGVDLFFCISGFIMTKTTAHRSIGVGSFLKKRALRVYPLYWLATLVGVALFIALPSVFLKQSISTDLIFNSLLLIPLQDSSGSSDGVPFLKVGWTLILEMYFYAVVAFSLLARNALARFAVQFTVIVGMILIGTAFHPTSSPMLFYTGTLNLEFLFGSAVGLLACDGRSSLIPKGVVAAVFLAGVGLFLIGGHGDSVARVLSFGVPSALIVATLVIGEIHFGRTVRSEWLLLIGNASYAIYLFHPFVLSFFRVMVDRVLPFKGPLFGAASVPLAVAVATAAGVSVHLVVEKRLNAFVRTLVSPRLSPLPAQRPG